MNKDANSSTDENTTNQEACDLEMRLSKRTYGLNLSITKGILGGWLLSRHTDGAESDDIGQEIRERVGSLGPRATELAIHQREWH